MSSTTTTELARLIQITDPGNVIQLFIRQTQDMMEEIHKNGYTRISNISLVLPNDNFSGLYMIICLVQSKQNA